jgi:hypothetical protein
MTSKTQRLLKRKRLSLVLYALVIYWLGLQSGLFFCCFNATPLLEPNHQLQRPHFNDKVHLSSPVISNDGNFVPLKPSELNVPTPIIVMGLMKAGTTSIYGYFKCGLDPYTARISHYNCAKKHGIMSCGKRMRRNITKKRVKAFKDMDMFHVYTELDGQEHNGGITVPQWQFLEEIYAHFPSATWILNLRDPQDWLSSVDRWQDLRQRFIDNPFNPILPRGKGEDDKDMIRFYEVQAERIKDFVKTHPSLTLVEVKIDSPDAGTTMEDTFGISADKCWKRRNANDGNAMWGGN